ncbi:alpha/beta fold hydrolase [Patescibacteria group bacterium]|nr:alpha/beta fold hydrolase [Patescibacteria group bacterium]
MNFSFVSFLTPKKVNLKGLWLGRQKPENLFIFLHGLNGSVFSRSELMTTLATGEDAVLTFINRGSGTINYFKTAKKNKERLLAGVAHEVFTDCLDDIDGALDYALAHKPKNIFLIGHSTGCQKSIYYLSKRAKSKLKGAILLAPISDYASVNLLGAIGKRKYRQALKEAQVLVKAGKSHTLLTSDFMPREIDAQRFISLYTADSKEEIFNYSSGKKSKDLLRVKQPILAFLAGYDEYADRSAEDITTWLESHNKPANSLETIIIPEADHGFTNHEQIVKKEIRLWLKKIK